MAQGKDFYIPFQDGSGRIHGICWGAGGNTVGGHSGGARYDRAHWQIRRICTGDEPGGGLRSSGTIIRDMDGQQNQGN